MGTSTHAYGELWYWDHRYQQDPGPFDWYQKYNTLAPLLDLYLQRHHRVLLVGCGNSTLGEGMVNNGYEDVVNIDISSVVIESMQKKYQDHPRLKFYQLDARNMNIFKSGFFDAVIDKGTLDSLMCGPQAQQNATKMIEEVGRVLKDKGTYILVTYGDPSYRLYLLQTLCPWDINLHVIGNTRRKRELGSTSLKFLFFPWISDRLEKVLDQKTWEVTKQVPRSADGRFLTAVLGPNPEVHYIYVCIKDEKKKQQDTTASDYNETGLALTSI